MMRKLFAWFLFVLPLAVFAQQYANAYLNIGVGARALALGGNVVARNSLQDAAYWNSAALSYAGGQGISLMHAAYFGNMAQLDWVSYIRRTDDKSAVAFSLLRFGVDNIMNTTKLIDENGDVNYNNISYFSVADYALMMSYGRRSVWRNLDMGITAKLLYRHIGDFATGYGFGVDAGLLYSLKQWKFGMNLKDLTTTFTFWQFNRRRLQEIRDAVPGQNLSEPDGNEISVPHIQLGIGRRIPVKNPFHLTAETDMKIYFAPRNALISGPYFSLSPGLALEGDYKKTVFLRAGIHRIYRGKYYDRKIWYVYPSAGIGLKFKYLQFDYAFTDFASDIRFSHVFSFAVDLRMFKSRR